MKYAAILELRLSHPFYADGGCPGIAIELAAEATDLLCRHRCLVRGSPGTVQIIAPLGPTQQPLFPLPVGASLRFELRIADTDFALFTDLFELRRTPSPMFSNATLPAGATGALPLTTRTTWDSEARKAVPARQPLGVLAEVELVIPSRDPGAQTAVFQVGFVPRQWRWAYYCITDCATDELHIVDASPAATPDALQFSDANRTDLDAHPDPSDPIAAQLAARHPDLRRARFLSDQPVACREEPRKLLELRLGADRVSSPLPNPSLRSFTQRGPPQEDLLFQIIEYHSHPFSNP